MTDQNPKPGKEQETAPVSEEQDQVAGEEPQAEAVKAAEEEPQAAPELKPEPEQEPVAAEAPKSEDEAPETLESSSEGKAAKEEKAEKADKEDKAEAAGKPLWKSPRFAAAAIASLIALAAAAWGYGSWFYSSKPLAFPKGAQTVDVDINAGMSGRQIAESTRKAGIDVTVPAMLLAMRLTKGGAIHAGRYRFERGVTLKKLLAKYQAGDVVKGTFRIADGATLYQTLQALSKVEEVKGSAATMTPEQLIQAIGAEEKHLEGLLAPETYKFSWGTKDVTVLRIAYRHQKKALEEEWAARGEDLQVKTPYEALILASIIEKETGQPEDRPLVSSVFHNRLKARMRLQTDPAVIYGQGPDFEGRLRTRHLKAPGPYNTYINTGLPPTPIAMPSRASIHAALHPAKTDLFYFVARGDGTTQFSRSLAEHEKAVDIYQRGKKK